MAVTATIESRDDYKATASDQYRYWSEELRGSMKRRESWWKKAEKIVARFLDERKEVTEGEGVPFRLNLFHSNVKTLKSMLYGNVPKIDVSRRYADPNDDVSRVAAEVMERVLNNDVAENGEEINAVLRSVLEDRLLVGLGCARVRYEVETEEQTSEVIGPDGVPAQETFEALLWEDAPIDYFYWGDVLWGWGRNWAEIPWLAFRVYMTRDEAKAKWGEDVAKALTYKRHSAEDDTTETEQTDIWQKAEVWEVWDKTRRQVVFVSLGYDRVLGTRDDPLGLSGFYPAPPFFIANATTKLYAPTPDYHMAQDLYSAVDKLQSRIATLTEAVKVAGVYDKSATGVERLLAEGVENKLVPIDNWALFGEKGGMQGQIDWLPIEAVTNALDRLRALRDETIGLLQQVTGMNEVMRGGSQGQYEGVGQAQLQAKFGSIQIQALQDEFAIFASNLLQLKAEVISLHFSPETIVARSNIASSFDKELAPAAIELIKDPKQARLKIEIRPESVAMVDYAQLKAERTDYINALAVFMQSAAPLIEQNQQALPFLMQLLKWGLAGFKGAQEIEGIIDKAIDQATQQAKQPQQDPQAAAAAAAQQTEQMKGQIELSKIQAKAAADAKLRELDRDADIATAMAAHQARMAEIEAEVAANIAGVRAKMEADLRLEQAQAESNILQTEAAASAEIGKDAASIEMEVGKEAAKTNLKINEIHAAAAAKIREARAKPESNADDSDE